MKAAYEALPANMRARLAPMKTENTLISSARMATANMDIVKAQKSKDAAGEKPIVQPLIRTHPDRGSKAIWFHQSKTERVIGMEPLETQEFLTELLETAIRPEFTYNHDYQLGDMLVINGSVKRKLVEGSRHLVEIEQLAHNQHDELSVIGSGIVELPSRATGHHRSILARVFR